jgi:hypothetical protein
MLPSAPVTFSTMMGWRNAARMRSERILPTTSVELPAAKGTIIVIGRVG